MNTFYDTIGLTYASLRRPDPRIAAQIHRALGESCTVVNVGAGAGSYEPEDRMGTAVEPSSEMIAQRPASNAGWLGPVEVSPVPIPRDCTDGFLAACWGRPAAYLDPRVRASMSSFWKIGDVAPGLERLHRDLDDGA